MTLPEALSTLQGWLPPNPADDTPQQAAARVVVEAELIDLAAVKAQANATPQPPTKVIYMGRTDGLPGTNNPNVSLVAFDAPPGTDIIVIERPARFAQGGIVPKCQAAVFDERDLPLRTPGEETG